MVYLSRSPQKVLIEILCRNDIHRLCIMSSNFKAPSAKSSRSDEAQAIDIYINSLGFIRPTRLCTWCFEIATHDAKSVNVIAAKNFYEDFLGTS